MFFVDQMLNSDPSENIKHIVDDLLVKYLEIIIPRVYYDLSGDEYGQMMVAKISDEVSTWINPLRSLEESLREFNAHDYCESVHECSLILLKGIAVVNNCVNSIVKNNRSACVKIEQLLFIPTLACREFAEDVEEYES